MQQMAILEFCRQKKRAIAQDENQSPILHSTIEGLHWAEPCVKR